MQSDDRGGTDSPTSLEDKGRDVTSDQNQHMATSTRQARQGSATSSVPSLSASTEVVVVAVVVVVLAWRMSKAVGKGNGGGQPIQIQQRQRHCRWVGIAIVIIIVRNNNAPVVDVIVVDPQTWVIKIAASADGRSRCLRDSLLLCDDHATNNAPAGYGR
jgi:hypothetical protein